MYLSIIFIIVTYIIPFATINVNLNLIKRNLYQILRSDACFYDEEKMSLEEYFNHDTVILRLRDSNILRRIEGNIDYVDPNLNIQPAPLNIECKYKY